VASHFECIGIPAASREEMVSSIARVAELAGSTDLPDGGRLLSWADESGARLSLVTDSTGSIECLTPAYAAPRAIRVAIGGFLPNPCAYETPLVVDLLDERGETCAPLAIQIDDLATSRYAYPNLRSANLMVGALTEQWELYRSEDDYRASGTPVAVQSLIPSGMFTLPGREQGFEASPRALISGTIEGAHQRVNQLFNRPFVHLEVRSYCATFDVLAPGTLAAVGDATIVKGTFWLSGRCADA